MFRLIKFVFRSLSVIIALIAIGLGYLKLDQVNRQKFFAKFLSSISNVNNTDMMNIRCQKVLDPNNVYGDILEIGAGTGINFPCLYKNKKIRSYIGIEPNSHMKTYFHDFIKSYPADFEIRLMENSAADLSDVESNSVDTVIMTLVLCSVPDPLPTQILLEAHRVLKPGGKFLFLEHTLADPNTAPLIYGFQRMIEPVWAIIGDGCRFKPMANYFDDMKKVFSKVNYEKGKAPIPLFFVKDILTGQLIK